MENVMNTSVYAGISAVPCAVSAAATLEVRGAATRELPAAVAAVQTWDDATRGLKRTGFAPARTEGSLAWSPPL